MLRDRVGDINRLVGAIDAVTQGEPRRRLTPDRGESSATDSLDTASIVLGPGRHSRIGNFSPRTLPPREDPENKHPRMD